MKRATASLLLAVFLCSNSAIAAEQPKPSPVLGADWLIMSPKEKTDYLVIAMKFLSGKGIPLRKPIGYYGQAINLLTDKPGSEKALVLDLLTSIVYKEDPRARPLIDKMKRPAAKTVSLAPSGTKTKQRVA